MNKVTECICINASIINNDQICLTSVIKRDNNISTFTRLNVKLCMRFQCLRNLGKSNNTNAWSEDKFGVAKLETLLTTMSWVDKTRSRIAVFDCVGKSTCCVMLTPFKCVGKCPCYVMLTLLNVWGSVVGSLEAIIEGTQSM